VRGTLDDDTATVVLQYTDTNENLQTIPGLVERGGYFWVENVPLQAGDNNITIIATDAAGNSSSTNIGVSQSETTLTITPLGADALESAFATVYGTVDDMNCDISVNGVEGINWGDGTWEVDNVPMPQGGTVMLVATAQSGSSTTQTGLELDLPYVVYTQQFSYHLHFDDWNATDNYEETYDATMNWARGGNGKNIITDDYIDTLTGNETTDTTETDWPADSGYIPTLTGTTVVKEYFNGVLEINWTYTNISVPDMEWMEKSSGSGDGTNEDYGDITWTESSGRLIKLFTGGKALRKMQNLFNLSAGLNVESETVGYSWFPDWPDDYDGSTPFLSPTSESIPPEEITLGAAGQLQSDGQLWTIQPDGEEIDITPQAPQESYEGNLPGDAKYLSCFYVFVRQPNAPPSRSLRNGTDFGHAYWGLSNVSKDAVIQYLISNSQSTNCIVFLNTSVGYGFNGGVEALRTNNPEGTAPGVVSSPDTEPTTVSRKYEIGFQELLNGLNYTLGLANNPGTYSIGYQSGNWNTCVTQTVKCGAAVGVTLPSGPNDEYPQIFGYDLPPSN